MVYRRQRRRRRRDKGDAAPASECAQAGNDLLDVYNARAGIDGNAVRDPRRAHSFPPTEKPFRNLDVDKPIYALACYMAPKPPAGSLQSVTNVRAE